MCSYTRFQNPVRTLYSIYHAVHATSYRQYAVPFLHLLFFFLMIRRPPRSTLFPNTPLFRSGDVPGRRSQTAATGADRPKRDATTAVKLCVLICFEDVIPGLTRQSANDDIDFLLNLTNDGWFGESAAQWQQAANGVFRAVENGLPLVRCTNNGLTCWIDSRGRLREILRSESGDVYGPGFLVAKIPLPSAGQRRKPTFYHRHGDWFGWGC